MATLLSDVLILANQYDVSGDANTLAIEYGADAIDDTVFGADTRTLMGGLKFHRFSLGGFYRAATGAIDTVVFPLIGTSDTLVTWAPTNTAGDRAFFGKTLANQYQPFGGSVGDAARFSLSGVISAEKFILGTLMEKRTGLTTTTNGTGLELGAVSATQSVYGVLHVVSADAGASPTLDVTVESDDNGSFTSATTRLTFAQVTTALTSEWVSAVGAITDTHWRVVMTVGGTADYDLFFALGIL